MYRNNAKAKSTSGYFGQEEPAFWKWLLTLSIESWATEGRRFQSIINLVQGQGYYHLLGIRDGAATDGREDIPYLNQ